jgi:hypothetical protein
MLAGGGVLAAGSARNSYGMLGMERSVMLAHQQGLV